MADVLDYLAWRGDLRFSVSPVNETDRYFFACAGTPDYSGIIPDTMERMPLRKAVRMWLKVHPGDSLGLIASELCVPVLRQACACPRYKDVEVCAFVNRILPEQTEQFSALTVFADGVTYVTFRGTDDTLIGWKENCELAVLDTVPAQRDALAYLERIAAAVEGPLRVAGHSKGGNLAVYAACMASPEVQERIEAVTSYDGPGFRDDFFAAEGYARMAGRITTYVPYRSVVGMLFHHAGRLVIIRCDTAGVRGHDGFTWSCGRDGFLPAEELSETSRAFRETIAETLEGMDRTQRREMIEDVFEVIGSTGAYLLTDLTEQNLKQALELSRGLRHSAELRGFLMKLARRSVVNRIEVKIEDMRGREPWK